MAPYQSMESAHFYWVGDMTRADNFDTGKQLDQCAIDGVPASMTIKNIDALSTDKF